MLPPIYDLVMGVSVPGGQADLTAAWLDAALRESGVIDVEIDGLDVEPLPAGKGLLGDLFRVRPGYTRGTGPDSMIVKLPASAPGSRQVGAMLRAWAREVAFYRQVAPHSPGTRLPTCFHTGEDEAAERWVLVLQDCPGDEFDTFAGATPTQAAAAVDALADFHAIWWQSTRTFDWMPGFDTTGVGGLQGLWLESLPHFIERFAPLLPDPTPQWVLEFAPRLSAWSESAATEPLTMVHADYRIDNLLFDGDSVTMIDWQTAMRAPAAMDLSCFLSTSLTITQRRQIEAELVDRYLARLSVASIDVDRQWFLRSYDENLLWWMGQFGNNLAHLEPDDPAVQSALDTMAERVYTAGLDHDVIRLLH